MYQAVIWGIRHVEGRCLINYSAAANAVTGGR